MIEQIDGSRLIEQLCELAEPGLRDSSNIYDLGRYAQLLE
jgi:hypothetical protein